jgi:hypothetical protein
MKSAMILTIKKANGLTRRGRKSYAKWLRKQADELETQGYNYAKNFRARYLVGK